MPVATATLECLQLPTYLSIIGFMRAELLSSPPCISQHTLLPTSAPSRGSLHDVLLKAFKDTGLDCSVIWSSCTARAETVAIVQLSKSGAEPWYSNASSCCHDHECIILRFAALYPCDTPERDKSCERNARLGLLSSSSLDLTLSVLPTRAELPWLGKLSNICPAQPTTLTAGTAVASSSSGSRGAMADSKESKPSTQATVSSLPLQVACCTLRRICSLARSFLISLSTEPAMRRKGDKL